MLLRYYSYNNIVYIRRGCGHRSMTGGLFCLPSPPLLAYKKLAAIEGEFVRNMALVLIHFVLLHFHTTDLLAQKWKYNFPEHIQLGVPNESYRFLFLLFALFFLSTFFSPKIL